MRSRHAVVPVLLLGMGLASCSAPASGGDADQDTLTVVASTATYGNIARQVAGDGIEVESVIDRPSQDPHSYEATPQDKLTLSHADLIVANGGGYDSFIDTLTRDLGTDASDIISAVDYSEAAHDDGGTGEAGHADHDHAEESDHEGHDHAAFNEHVWYDLPTASAVATEIAQRLGELKPEDATAFTANAKKFASAVDQLEARAAKTKGLAAGKDYAMTEPVPYYLLRSIGLTDGTPQGFSSAIEEGNDVSPLTLDALNQKMASGDFALLAYNPQTSSPQTAAVRAQAESAGIPVVEFTETLPEGMDYQGWMGTNIDAVAAALEG